MLKPDFYFEPRKHTVLLSQLSGFLLRGYYRKFIEQIDLHPHERVLDYCSGSGILTQMAAAKIPVGKLTFVDVSLTWLSIAATRLQHHSHAHGLLLEQLDGPLASQSFDAAILHFALHDFAPPLRPMVIRHIKQNLKPGGVLYLREPLNPRHGMKIHEIIDLLRLVGGYEYQYQVGKYWQVGRYADFRCQLESI